MLKLKLEDLNKIYKNKKEDAFNSIKFEKNGKLQINKFKNPKETLKILPEQESIKMQKRKGIDSPDFIRAINFKNLTIIQNNAQNKQIITKKQNSNSIINKREISFPKINSVKNKNAFDLNYFKKHISINKNLSPRQEISDNKDNRTFFKQKLPPRNNENIFNKENNTFFQKPLINKEEEKIKIKNIKVKNKDISKNETLKVESLKSNIKINNNMQLNKIKNINRNSTFINNFKEISKHYNLFKNNKFLLNDQKIKNSTYMSPIPNNSKELNDDKMKSLINILNILKNYSPSSYDGVVLANKKIVLNSKIFKNKYKNMKESIISTKKDIKKNDFIKGYAYNSCIGNIRSSNEDEITVTKIYFNDDLNNFCYYFGLFDGHGGNGCSNYLKKNLHKNIKEFSVLGIKIAIDITEERFLSNEAIDEKDELKDSSGSCGIILMVKNNKCIIANIGDSRLVVIKNKSIDFVTMDHKPDSIIEKSRIELAGGKIYKAPSLFQQYQIDQNLEIPWWVLPGRLNVSRTFGDLEAKEEKYGGKKTVVIALPDITEVILDENYNFIIIGCDGIFDVLSNEELIECINIVIKEKKINDKIKKEDIHKLCGDFADMIIKSALEKYSFDNLSCIVIAINLNNFLSLD